MIFDSFSMTLLLLLLCQAESFAPVVPKRTRYRLPAAASTSAVVQTRTLLQASVMVNDTAIAELVPQAPQQAPPQQEEDDAHHEVEEEEASINAADDFDYWFRFGGVARLYSNDKGSQEETDEVMNRLQSATVAVVGLGGIGSWAAESLGRSGIGHIVLLDLDDLCISSTNRQLHALSSNIGVMKTDEVRRRLQAIYPNIKVTVINDFIMKDNVNEIVSEQLKQDLKVQAVIDAITGSEEKAALWMACNQQNIPVVACGSAAGRFDPTKIVCNENPKGDAMLEAAVAESSLPITCVYSPAQEEGESSSTSSFRTEEALGSASFVSGTMGLVAASKVVEGIARNKL